jgi:DNA-binding NarL/FixJ family response regulator
MLVDDHNLIREAVKTLIEFDDDIYVIAEARDGNECLDKLNYCSPDIIILDISMPHLNGLQTLNAIRKKKGRIRPRRKRPKILILTAHSEMDYLLPAFKGGVEGYLLKSSDSRELRNAIHLIMNGERFIQPSLIPILNSNIITTDMDKEKIDLLTNREMEVLKLVAAGFANKDISGMLKITERTVKNHLYSIYKKIDCADRTQATVFCIRNGLITVHD